jgi:exodeoxyribonuclease V gamma subunit
MIHLTYSNLTENILDNLAQAIQFERQNNTPWAPIQLLVPNATIKNYVRIQLAQRLGIAANLHFSYLDDIGKNLLSIQNCNIITIDIINLALLGILGDAKTLAKECLAPVRYYLRNDKSNLKLVQLASQLANLYNDYDLSRPTWIKKWRNRQHISTKSHTKEAWQQYLWIKATESLNKTGINHITLSEAVTLPNINSLYSNIYAFGFTHVTQIYYRVFARLGALSNLHLYTINPCQEFWEDLVVSNQCKIQTTKTSCKPIAIRSKLYNNQDHYQSISNEPEILRHWGQAGRKGITSLNTISQYDFEACFNFPESKTLLSKIQKDILSFQNSSTLQSHDADTSINFWACPNKRREAEILATEIWHLIELHSSTNKPLKFSDIAVVLPKNEEESYLANIQTAFLETHDIPWTRKNCTPSALAEIIDATKLLIGFPTSGFTRIDIMRVITHPIIAKNFGIINIEILNKFCSDINNNIEIDSFDLVDVDRKKEQQHSTSCLMGSNNTISKNVNDNYKSYKKIDPTNSIEYFLHSAKALLKDAKELHYGHKEPKKWLTSLKKYLSNWIFIKNKTAAMAAEQIFHSLNSALGLTPDGLPTTKINYAAVQFLVIKSIVQMHNEQPCHLTDGVVVTNITQICPISFRAVFILGLGEGAILETSTYTSLDLREVEHKFGDINQLEKEQYLLLETLVLTKEYLYLSYIAQDQLTGTPLESSHLFKDLVRFVKGYLKVGPNIQYHPTHRFDPIYFPELFSPTVLMKNKSYNYSPMANSEAMALWLGQNRCRNQLLDLPYSAKIKLAESLDIKIQKHKYFNHQKCTNTASKNCETILSIKDLTKWLECPLTGAAAVRLGLHSDVKEELLIEDEALNNDTRDTYALLRNVTIHSAYSNCAPEKLYDDAIKKIKSQKRSLFGIFSQIERDANLALIHSWLTLLEGNCPKVWHIGPMQINNNIANNYLTPLSLKVPIKGKECQINIIGKLLPQLWNGSIFFEIGRPTKSNLVAMQKKALRAYIDQIILSCITHKTSEHHAWFLFSGEEGNSPEMRSITFKPMDEFQGYHLLNNWIRDLFENDQEILMPIEAILTATDKENLTEQYISDYIETNMSSGTGRFSSMYGPVPNISKYSPPSNLTTIVSRRLASFLSQIHTFDIGK